MIKFRDLLEWISDHSKIKVVGSGAHGLYDLYKDKIKLLKEILVASDYKGTIMFIKIECTEEHKLDLIKDTEFNGE